MERLNSKDRGRLRPLRHYGPQTATPCRIVGQLADCHSMRRPGPVRCFGALSGILQSREAMGIEHTRETMAPPSLSTAATFRNNARLGRRLPRLAPIAQTWAKHCATFKRADAPGSTTRATANHCATLRNNSLIAQNAWQLPVKTETVLRGENAGHSAGNCHGANHRRTVERIAAQSCGAWQQKTAGHSPLIRLPARIAQQTIGSRTPWFAIVCHDRLRRYAIETRIEE